MEMKRIIVSHDNITNHLDDVSTSISKGKVTTIIGPNGCGKSTLLSVLSRSNMPTSGTASLENRDLVMFKPKEFAKKLAIVYQQNEVPKDLTIEKLVSFGRLPHKTLLQRNQEEDRKAIDWALSVTNLTDKRHNDLEALSGGERQRVWIAMALAQQSEILCLDEPTTYLDIYYQIELLELVKSLNEDYGLTIVMVLHDINQAIRYSDEIIMMKNGRIIAEGPPREIITKDIIKEVYGVNAIFKEDDELGLYMMSLGI
ncbi:MULTISPECIES: ABC transporter ATP-binding protein [unclassified Sporosarcina]|uniref:ABC transporter ATP-binding protein n=1 Tax=unclassified Sporosarcina TaxID=2647733 RepID=UPI000C1692D2|nr:MULTISPECIES: ABC transporter ATP-binding protein [unclassified Sporosarcina]PID06331.1 iron ABC transporter ATP-binding protein [Sporosarcina sp. P30]PID09525.1 iron ABC transporter ATP-binding protein [Sporosarcina sp. P31]PID12823.1 iron ABC transporter ATP-binding protein [Sporosarcina sp. P32b]